MTEEEKILLKKTIDAQREFFLQGKSKNIVYRKEMLKKLFSWVKENQSIIEDALYKDLGKSSFESFATEVGIVLEEAKTMSSKVSKYSKKVRVSSPLSQFPSKSYIMPEPYGVVLIMSPWNYPFQLTLVPLVDALAAGNCVVLKPSNYTPFVNEILKKLVSECFPPELVSIFLGGHEVNTCILEEHFDYMFFTGSPTVGKIVMEAAAKYLTPLSLELGGKSPCVIDKDCDIDLAAKRVIWGKGLNAGQTCVAPDYVLVEKTQLKKFSEACIKWIRTFWGDHSEEHPAFPKIISQRHFDRLQNFVTHYSATKNIAFGGVTKNDSLKIGLTLLLGDEKTPTLLDSPIMQEEIFGPILPIIPVQDIAQAKQIILSKPRPLALYLFTNSKAVQNDVMTSISFGGGCINDTIVHLVNPNMPFGGVGNSGMGSYHGKYGFDTFSHKKSILKKSTKIDIALRYPPYTQEKKDVAKHFLG